MKSLVRLAIVGCARSLAPTQLSHLCVCAALYVSLKNEKSLAEFFRGVFSESFFHATIHASKLAKWNSSSEKREKNKESLDRGIQRGG